MLYGVDTLLASCPFLGIIVNGNFFVHLFLLISGYVMAWQTIQMKSERLGLFCFKRYLKLVFAIAVCAAIAFAEFAFNAIKDGQSLGAILKEAHKFFRAIFIDVPFCGDIRIYGPFWMLNYIFLGGIFVALISSLAWVLDGKKVFLAAAVIVLALYASLTAQNVHWASVMLGCALCLFNAFYGVQFGKAALLLLLAALFFGSYPTGLIPSGAFKPFVFPVAADFSPYYWHSFASFLLILFMLNCQAARNFLSKKAFLALGKISLWVYILHGFSISWAERLLGLILPENGGQNYVLTAGLSFLTATAILLLASLAMAKFITPLGNKLVEKIIGSMAPSDTSAAN